MSTNEPAWMPLAEGIWRWGLVPLRAHKVESRPNPDEAGSFLVTRHIAPLEGAELLEFNRACKEIDERASRAGIDKGALVLDIARALEQGAHKAAAMGAKRIGRLTPEQRRQYRQQAAAARGLAQWLAKEIAERPIPTSGSGGVVNHVFTEHDDREPLALADILIQRYFAKLTATATGAEIDCDGGPRSVAPGLCRAVGAVNDLHWIADLLRADADRSRPQGAPVAPWKGTAALLWKLFKVRFGEPLLGAVAALAGLAHQCEVPLAELSRLSKP